jgi:acetyltransferase-like isoleucine patch superfamily enzyme
MAALAAAMPSIVSFTLKSRILGANRALEGSSQALALLPGLPGRYIRQAFLSRALAACHETAVIEFGTIFSQVGARLDERVYVGPHCHLGLVHLGAYVMLAPGVHIPSGARTHAVASTDEPIQLQPLERQLIRIGSGCWIGSGAVVMAEVGSNTIVGAASVVTRPLPANVVAAGVPARVIRQRRE